KSIALPDVPEKEGYTGSWPNYTLGAEDITIEAVYKINYYYAFYKDGDAEEMVACMEYGSPLLKPDTDPVKEGYTFGGWVDADGKSPEDYDGMPAKDLTFNAVWNINTYTVTFNTDGGSAIAPVNVTYGAAIPAPANPVKEGFVFTGWSPAIPATMPANDLTFTAQWLNPTANTILKVGSDKKVDYKATVTVIAKAENVPDGCIVVICDESGAILARGDKSSASITFEEMTSGKTLVAKVIGAGDKVCKDGSGAEIAKSVKIEVKTGFFDKIIAFFRGLFKALPKETVQP
ncbi:MAG: InlB B-repeat-containing protein, partial [Clostridia bacterium]|nr:InlB B-repeat-containing protein [Clostridia bacterium]